MNAKTAGSIVTERREIFLDYKAVIPTPKHPDGVIVGLMDNGQYLIVNPNLPDTVVRHLEQQNSKRVNLVYYTSQHPLDLDPSKTYDVNGSQKSLAELVDDEYELGVQLKARGGLKGMIKRGVLPTTALAGGFGITIAGSLWYNSFIAIPGIVGTACLLGWSTNTPREKELARQKEQHSNLIDAILLITMEEGKKQGIIPQNYGVPYYRMR